MSTATGNQTPSTSVRELTPPPPLYEFTKSKETETGLWAPYQVFFTAEPPDTQPADIITASAFSHDGEHIAIGDKGGRIWIYSTDDGRNACKPWDRQMLRNKFSIFKDAEEIKTSRTEERGRSNRNDEDEENMYANKGTKDNSENNPQSQLSATPSHMLYDFYGQFQSHQPGFDYLKSLEIEERINCISWCRTGMNYLMNFFWISGKTPSRSHKQIMAIDKTIKLWKVFEKSLVRYSGHSSYEAYQERKQHEASMSSIYVPDVQSQEVITAAISRRVYSNGHNLDVSPDCETFISCDDLRINLWHLDSPNDSYLLCDRKPDDMEELRETITSAFLHPQHCGLMAYTFCTEQQTKYFICFSFQKKIKPFQYKKERVEEIQYYVIFEPMQKLKGCKSALCLKQHAMSCRGIFIPTFAQAYVMDASPASLALII
ncbi:protein phosphatase PP2A regulatory subunit B [Reticulomyxa filosa]|uniref:Protein phosphatase PP2A regulatory subunit B n=1 Tax=Reticulomyxa filosa TaxID=46433 RepID=X6LYZ9_RETFI|nr:protein phosphatase PP2A regulatory subunit B [Reticulomyxa filosa]|eukprot:ETO07163.1 protein phosphatase PP2A regulatory subunit B [Reticulomyxa filosa]